jgi:cytochrome c biogenesis protein CcmG/thiol:disulfide interchange protein DsbE
VKNPLNAAPRSRIASARTGGAVAIVAALILSACTSPVPIDEVPPLETVTTADVLTVVDSSDRPVVLNVWASWCIPCRSEAPLLSEAATRFSEEVAFVGLNVRDSQSGSRSFIAEFFPEAPISHFADPGGAIPVDLGASRGVPITIFYRADGSVHAIHHGVIDERTLALQIDELLADV